MLSVILNLNIVFLVSLSKHQIKFLLPFCYLYIFVSGYCISLSAVYSDTRYFRLISLTFAALFLLYSFTVQVPTDGQAGQQSGPSRVAAVGPYIQSSTMPRGPVRHDMLVKPAYPDGTATLPSNNPQSKAGTGEQSETAHCLQPFTLLIQAVSFLTIT